MADHWLPWQRPLRNPKKLNLVNKPLHPSTNTEILVKNGLLGSELLGLESQPFKKIKKIKKKTLAKYIALPASLPSRLNSRCTYKKIGQTIFPVS